MAKDVCTFLKWAAGKEKPELFMGPVTQKSPKLFRLEKPFLKLRSACFEKLVFQHLFTVTKIKMILECDVLQALSSEVKVLGLSRNVWLRVDSTLIDTCQSFSSEGRTHLGKS